MNKVFWRAALIRAARTTAQELVTTLPVGFAITPVMIQTASWSSVWIAILCWLATGLLGGVGSLLTSYETYNGQIWRSTVDNNVWEPGVYGWEEST